jgi:hypothetical protein
MRRAFALLGLSASFVVAWMAMLAPQAVATVEGPCTASIGGEDVTTGHDDPGSAVSLPSGESVPVAGTAQGRVTDLTYTVHVAGAGVQVGTVTLSDDGRSWTGAVDLEEISNATVGVFEVTASVQTEAGDCSGVAFVCIEGRTPFTTAAGAGAAALGVGGGILLALSLVKARGMGSARSALQGFAGGATAGLGGAVLLQQFCTLPLSAASAAGIPASLGAAGAVGASLLRRVGTRGARRAARLRTRRPGAGVPSGEPTKVLERGAERVHHVGDHAAGGRELIDAGRGAGGPSASAPGGPSPAPGAPGGPGGGPSPAPGAPGGPGGGPSPAPGAPGGPGGGPSPAPGAPGGPGGGPSPAPGAPGGPGGGPSPAPGAPGGPGGGPSPAPGAPGGPGGGPSPAPGAPGGPGGGPSPAPGAPPSSPTPGGVVLPPMPPGSDDDRVCSNCGTENSSDSQFCTNCGTRLG